MLVIDTFESPLGFRKRIVWLRLVVREGRKILYVEMGVLHFQL